MTDLPPNDIQWEAPASCPNLQSVRAATERLLGAQLVSLQGKNVRAEGHVVRSERGNWELHVRLAVGDRVEEETLVAKTCRSLGEAMALKVALAIDPLAVVDAVQRPPEPNPPTSPNAEPRPAAPRQPRVRDRQLGLRFVGGVGLGPLPGVTPGAGIFGSLQLPHFRFEVGGEAFWGGVAHYAAPSSVGADLQVFMGALRGCVRTGEGRWLFPICGGLELGAMRGRGFGVETTSTTSGLWGAVVVGPAVQFRMSGRLSLWVEADALVTVLKPGFYVRNLQPAYSPASAGSRASAGIEVNF